MTKETRHSDMHLNWLGYISDKYQCAPALCLETIAEGYPTPSAVPPLRLFQDFKSLSRMVSLRYEALSLQVSRGMGTRACKGVLQAPVCSEERLVFLNA